MFNFLDKISALLTFNLFKTKVEIQWTIPAMIAVIFCVTSLDKAFLICQNLLIVYTIILVHEFGHIFAARYFKYTIDEMQLTIFGGIARLTEEIKEAKALFWVTIWGPLTHVIFVLAALPFINLSDINVEHYKSDTLVYFIVTNTVLFLFNLLPIPPMDGGRILTSIILFFKKSHVMSSFYAAIVGALLVIPVSVFFAYVQNYTVILIMIFVSYNLYFNIKAGIDTIKCKKLIIAAVHKECTQFSVTPITINKKDYFEITVINKDGLYNTFYYYYSNVSKHLDYFSYEEVHGLVLTEIITEDHQETLV